MSNADEVRWQQRFEHFQNALAQLDAACDKSSYSDLERAGLVQVFEFSFELAWKTLKDLLFYEGFEVQTPRESIRKAFEAEYLAEETVEALMDALEKRNLLAHTYRPTLAEDAERLIKTSYHPALLALRDTLAAKLDDR